MRVTGPRPTRLLLVVGVLVPVLLGAAPARAGTSDPAAAGDRLGTTTLLSGLEQVVGQITPVVAAQLPVDPRLWGAYAPATTPERCANGATSCVDTTIAGMSTRFGSLVRTCDHDAVFSLLYLRVTERYRAFALDPGFLSTTTVNHQDAVFADLYTKTWDRWHANDPRTVPPVWRLAYASADTRQVSGTGDALLGMSAHILRDLPFALWRVQLGQRADHLAINGMLESVYDDVATEMSRRLDPTILPGDVVPGTGTLIVDAIAQWREKAWRDAVQLIGARDATEFAAITQRIEREAWTTSLGIYLASRYPVQTATVVRDAYCVTHGNSERIG